MLTLYHAPRTRSVRTLRLLEELGIPFELKALAVTPPSRTFSQPTPTGKLPVLVDEGVTISELGVLDDRFPELHRYMKNLEARPAFQKAAGEETEAS